MNTDLIKELRELISKFKNQLLLPWEAIRFLEKHQAELEAMTRDAERYSFLHDAPKSDGVVINDQEIDATRRNNASDPP